MLGSRQVCLALIIALAWGVLASGQGTPPVAAQQLYLLAGTPSQDYGYPVTLYRADASKLKVVRGVISQSEGLNSVQAWGNVIFLIHPGRLPSGEADSDSQSVAVIHTDQPMLADDVVIHPEPDDFFIASYFVAVAEPRPLALDELVPSFAGGVVAGNLKLLNVSSDLNASGSRLRPNTWEEYTALRREGDPGGPVGAATFFVTISGKGLVLTVFDAPPLVLDSVPPAVQAAAKETGRQRLDIIAASQQYLLLKREYEAEDWSAGKPGNSTEVFIHDRVRDRWKTIQLEGNRTRSRLFGSWLATIVGIHDPNGKPGPGRENERGAEAFGNYEIAGSKGNDGTARFPLVRGAYPADIYTPGILVLQNLADDRKIRIETRQEDSEILSVSGQTVFYRVNDSIYQARIVGSQLQNTSIVVKDEDVPEIHWVFWGPQTH